MRIACLQFAPRVGEVDANVARADAVLGEADEAGQLRDLDLLVLPELSFSGYNFKSREHIRPFLEEAGSGITCRWARDRAVRHGCAVIVGYPERTEPEPGPADTETGTGSYYNSATIVSGGGEVVGNYRKAFLYYTDETWAREGDAGFFEGEIPGLGNAVMGICMDINPYKFTAPWDAYEFAHHALRARAKLVVLSMAWLTREDEQQSVESPLQPDLETLSYWISRMEPLIRDARGRKTTRNDKDDEEDGKDEEETIVVFCNRCGREDEAVYAGTSTVLGIRSGGEVVLYGNLGRAAEGLLVVDTEKEAPIRLIRVSREEEAADGGASAS